MTLPEQHGAPGSSGPPHVPVLLDRVVALFADAPEGVYLDGTLGAAGHAAAVLEARARRHGRASLVGLDRDPHALALAETRLARVGDAVETTLVRTRFDALGEVLDGLGIERVAGIFLDLGISSMHVDEAARGFSYRQDGPLDMRMDPDLPRSAADLVNQLEPRELARILRRFGDERFADRIARAVVAARPLTRTTELAEVVRNAIPAAARRTGGHPATRTFQALRIAVNGELEALEQVLPAALERLATGGVLAVLSYHSLEDRPVKRAFAAAATGCVCPPNLPVCACGRTPLVEHVIRKPERPDADEVAVNPRATAARLRAVRRLESHP
ncbi:ribosomal RNA small subunit methyltransferase H [Egicoccus halophilus]|uniref:Ribosomal RNA small subunit methyltransferase H n=2 Tax=Egicoccus halophilus TaxID=1670830 RepID=A0A8J3A696_9ACTN|nr:16S rRNA (cytosine(1402)-N(4))-methyltransferase RsmH [Egicoccus halophilus]GGI04311.1 ribosomal RNA small subunit methyltransferase H [Egicoccus halophilus]